MKIFYHKKSCQEISKYEDFSETSSRSEFNQFYKQINDDKEIIIALHQVR